MRGGILSVPTTPPIAVNKIPVSDGSKLIASKIEQQVLGGLDYLLYQGVQPELRIQNSNNQECGIEIRTPTKQLRITYHELYQYFSIRQADYNRRHGIGLFEGNIITGTDPVFYDISSGGARGCLLLGARNVIPVSNPLDCGVLYYELGALKYRSPGGKITTIATNV